MFPLPCPYVSPKGERCPGDIVKVEAFNADLRWTFDESGNWTFNRSQPRSEYHLSAPRRATMPTTATQSR